MRFHWQFFEFPQKFRLFLLPMGHNQNQNKKNYSNERRQRRQRRRRRLWWQRQTKTRADCCCCCYCQIHWAAYSPQSQPIRRVVCGICGSWLSAAAAVTERAWEQERVRARVACAYAYVWVCVCVNNSPPSKQNASAKGNFRLLGNFVVAANLNCGNFHGTIDNSCCACISLQIEVQKHY